MKNHSDVHIWSKLIVRLWIAAGICLAVALVVAQPGAGQPSFEEWAKARYGTMRAGTKPATYSRPAPASRAIPSKPARPPAPVVTEQQFLQVMSQSCVRCHPACASVQQIRQNPGWLVPGRPQSSALYTCIGVNKRAGGTYHNLSDADRRIVGEFIAQTKN